MTARRALPTVAVVLLVATAGCGLPGDSSPSPPGVDDGNVTDASELVRSHTDELRAGSFTVHAKTTRELPNADYRIVSEFTYHVDTGEPFRARLDVQRSARGDPPDDATPVPDMEMWRAGETTYVRTSTANGTRYRSVDLINSSLTMNDVTNRQLVARLNNRENATVTSVTRDGETHTRVSATVDPSGLVQESNITLIATSSGLVQRITATRVVRFPSSGEQTVTSDVRFRDVGNTTVERPDWYDEAVNATEGDE